MEEKVLKTSVYVNENLVNELLEVPIDVDFTLPDYCGDISKIFKCKAVPRILSKAVNAKSITIDGVVCITIIYCDKDGKLSSFEYQYPFNKTTEVSVDISSANLCCKIKTEYINCRAVTGRKVDIHGAVGITVKAFKRKCTDIISDFDDDSVELKRGVTPATVPMGYAEKYLIIEEDIRIGQGKPSVKSILRCDTAASVKETKVINGKAVVKGDMTVNILYCGEETDTPQCIKTVIPFSQIIDIIGITDECKCETKAEISFCEIKPKMSVSGENKGFTLNAKILLSSNSYCGNDIAVITDAFSKKYSADIKKDKVCFEKIALNVNENYTCKKTVNLDNDITSMVDLWCSVMPSTTKFESGDMTVSSSVLACMIVLNEEGNAQYVEKPIEFEYLYKTEMDTSGFYSDPQIEIVSASYTIVSANSVEIVCELSINASVYEKNEIMLISEMTVNHEKPIQKNTDIALTVYFANEGEDIWDIARNYNSSVDEIMNINNLETDILPNNKMLLVPML
ncbi:MAG: DUF3794 domain-containing protein [Clostridia bacterium]|nr:DUF3794 domain-containing protein [Clostridia bacterium]